MKKALLIIGMIVIFFAGCVKDDILEASKIEVTDVKVERTWYTANISGEYSYPQELEGIKVYLSEKKDMSNASEYECTLSDKMFDVGIKQLKSGVTYYYYIEYDNGYTKEKSENDSFKTIEKPTVRTSSVESVTKNSAVVRCSVINNDSCNDIKERGICWGTQPNPSISGNHVKNGSGGTATGTVNYSVTLSNLKGGTTYYVRAYIKSEFGVIYGTDKYFTTDEDVVKASVTTDAVSNVTKNTAICGGNVTSDGGGTVTARGVCWSTSQTPTIDDYRTANGTGKGTFTAGISGLTPNTTYYVRAYATNEAGTSYGAQKSFTTLGEVTVTEPTVSTNSVSSITANTAICGGNVTTDGGGTVTARGVCWSTSQTPTIDDYRTANGTGKGTFTAGISGLTPNTTYYVRAYATNEAGTSYGAQKSFTTLGDVTVTEPTVSTNSVSSITANTAICGGNVTSDGNGTVTARGICWSETSEPKINNLYSEESNEGTGTGSFTSSMTNLKANTTYYVRAYATNEAGTSYGEVKSFMTLEEEPEETISGTENGHDYVDLGLPSGLKWATCNVGANSPEEYGDYFAWGETTTKTEYTSENSVTSGKWMNDISGNAQYDAATANWGGNWRMPKSTELEELIENCTWTRTAHNGVDGYKVEGPNGNSIFLPKAGFRHGLSFNGNQTDYWSSTPVEDDDYCAYILNCYQELDDYGFRNIGRSVRPVFGGNFTEPEEQLPTVSTNSVSSITANTAICGGDVTSDGGGTVTARGVCWSTGQRPTIINNRSIDGIGTGSFTSSLSNLASQTTYYVRAYATNEVGTAYGEEVSFTTLERTFENGHEYVDLGLSVKWATCNVGANSPEEYGDYFAWGVTTIKSAYSPSNCPNYGLSISQLQSQGYIDSEGNLNPQYDAATANWGGGWRMPTEAEQEELLNNCTWTWTTYNGVKGYNVEGPNGNSIFLPAAGYRDGSSHSSAGGYGSYWSSTPYESFINYSYYLSFGGGGHNVSWDYRYRGRSVRPVSE